MPRYDYVCENEHIFEITAPHDSIPKHVSCPECHKPAVRSYLNMDIRTKVKNGTGGGRDMIQKKTSD